MNRYLLPLLFIALQGCIVTNPNGLFIKTIRSLNNPEEEKVTAGVFVEEIQTVAEPQPIAIAVPGCPDAKVTIYSPPDSGSSFPIILFLHGGGWVSGSAQNVSPYAKLLASQGYVVANLDYALAPEHHYPAPVIQSIEVINYLLTHADAYHGDASRLVIGGNSAGAQISSQLATLITNPSLAQQMNLSIHFSSDILKGVVLFNGVYNFDTAEETGFPGFRQFAWCYTGQKDYKNYPQIDELSSVKHITTTHPPAFLAVGDADPLQPQTMELDSALTHHNIDVTSVYWENKALNHDYMYDLSTEAGEHTFRQVIDFLRRQTTD